ncbi:MAG: PKD domain-containing protein [Myxococcales bacterium]|nr:PKD domain-containing protein [Myxococcales bacterium]
MIEKAKYGVHNYATGTMITQSEITGSGTAGLYANQGSLTGDALYLHHNGTSSSSTAVSVASGASASLTNALIYRNTGYGVYSDSGTTSLVNCTVHANSSYGLYFWYGTATLKNSIVSQNNSQGIYTYSTSYTASYNDVWGNTSGNQNGGSNSISLDPIYVNATEDNLHLQPNSPCIDTGTGTGSPDHDIENQPRPLQGRDPGSPLWDMGAYEFNRTANRYPVADAGPNRTVIKDEPASFSGSGSYDPDGTIVSYAWEFGDGNNGSGLDVTHTYATAGTYTLTLTVTDNGGLTGIDRATIHVNTRPVARGGPDKVAEINETVYFDGSASSDVDGTVVAWSWDFGDGQNASGAQVNHRYGASGNFTVTLTVTDDDGATGQDTVLVRVGSPGDTTGPVISHTQLGEQPAGQDVTVVASLSDENGIESAALYYRVSGAASFSQAPLAQVAGNQYAGTIPASAVTTAGVDYYLWARDGSANQNVSVLPGTAPAAFFHFNVVNLDTQPPAIAHTPIGDGQPEGTAVAIQATVTDGSGVDAVRLYFKGGSAIAFSSVAMSNTGGDTWQASIPAASVLWPRVEYYLEATDRASPANTGTLPADAPATTFSFSVARQIVAQPGDVIVTEIMADASLPEPASEWFELYNTTASDIDLTGWEVRDDGSDRFTIGGTLPVIIPSHGYLVLGRSSDPQANGSVPVDYVYGGMLLANSTDEIELRAGATVVDRVAYDKSAGWPIMVGAALSLDPAHLSHQDNDVAANWCLADATWAGGDFGSPGQENPVCSTPDDTEGPSITHTPVANGQPAGQDVSIQAAVTDPSGVASVTCRYRLQGATAWTDLSLASVGQDLYAAAIPGAAVALPGVEYYLEATDASANQNTRTLPAQGASAPFVFSVTQETEDREGPAISHQPVVGPVEAGTVVAISALVSDRSTVASVDLFYRVQGAGAYQHLAMAAGTGGLYTAEIPAATVTLPGVEYYLQATDGSPLANLTSLPADFAESPFFFAVQDSSDRDGPVISHTPPAGPVTEGTAVELRATATDASGVEDVTVWVYDANQAGFWPLRASPTGTVGEYTATVPASAVRLPELKYYIEAIDFSPNQNSSSLPANAPDATFSVGVEENTTLDHDPPVISGVKAEPDPARAKNAIAVQASITDASGIQQARLFFRMQGTQTFLSVDMAAGTGGVFSGEIPAAVVERGMLEYYLEARDTSPLENTARSPADAPNSLHFVEVTEDELPTDGGCGCGSGPAGLSLLPLVFLLRRRRCIH